MHYAAFDVLWLNGHDPREHELARRKRILKRLIRKPARSAVERLDLEGIVAKRLCDP